MSIKEYIFGIVANIDKLRKDKKKWELMENDIPGWQFRTRQFIGKRKSVLEKAIQEQRAKWMIALHVRDSNDELIEREIDEARRTLVIAPVTPHTMDVINKQRSSLYEMELLFAMKKGEQAGK